MIGRQLFVDGSDARIVGVMPPSFRFPQRTTGGWVPIAFNENDKERDSLSGQAAARLHEPCEALGEREGDPRGQVRSRVAPGAHRPPNLRPRATYSSSDSRNASREKSGHSSSRNTNSA